MTISTYDTGDSVCMCVCVYTQFTTAYDYVGDLPAQFRILSQDETFACFAIAGWFRFTISALVAVRY